MKILKIVIAIVMLSNQLAVSQNTTPQSKEELLAKYDSLYGSMPFAEYSFGCPDCYHPFSNEYEIDTTGFDSLWIMKWHGRQDFIGTLRFMINGHGKINNIEKQAFMQLNGIADKDSKFFSGTKVQNKKGEVIGICEYIIGGMKNDTIPRSFVVIKLF